MAAYGSISGDVRQADHWIVDHRMSVGSFMKMTNAMKKKNGKC